MTSVGFLWGFQKQDFENEGLSGKISELVISLNTENQMVVPQHYKSKLDSKS